MLMRDLYPYMMLGCILLVSTTTIHAILYTAPFEHHVLGLLLQGVYIHYTSYHTLYHDPVDQPILGHLLVGEGLPGLLRGILGLIELVSSYHDAL